MDPVSLGRGKLSVEIGGAQRTLQFLTQELILLEKRLEKDVLTFLGTGGSPNVFLQEAIFAGLSRTEKRISPTRISAWLDEYEGEREKLMVQILYAIAKALPGEDGRKLATVLDDTFPQHRDGGVPSKSESELIREPTRS